MKIKHLAFFLLMLFAISGSNCKKKISKYPFDMAGVWYSDNNCGVVLEINKNSSGKIFSLVSGCFVTDINEKGKIKYKKDVLYVDHKKFEIFNEPQTYNDNDSIDAPDENNFSGGKLKRRRILATMTLQEKGFFTFKAKL